MPLGAAPSPIRDSPSLEWTGRRPYTVRTQRKGRAKGLRPAKEPWTAGEANRAFPGSCPQYSVLLR